MTTDTAVRVSARIQARKRRAEEALLAQDVGAPGESGPYQ